jgi:hypothetical protein
MTTATSLLHDMKTNDVRPEGVCIRGVWTFLVQGEPVTRAVNTLKRRGLIDISYYMGGKAGVNLTDKGRS